MLYSGFTPVKRGRPVGSKNKSKSESVPVTPVKRGRPVGSKNKPKDVSVPVPTTPVKRGRPSGSPNKPGHSAGGRRKGAGRPLGSKTKVRITLFDTNEPVIKKRGRQSGTKDLHTRKSKKSTAAAIVIQTAWRSHIDQ